MIAVISLINVKPVALLSPFVKAFPRDLRDGVCSAPLVDGRWVDEPKGARGPIIEPPRP